MSDGVSLALVFSVLRHEEKELLREASDRSLDIRRVREADLSLPPDGGFLDVHGVLLRGMSHFRSLYTARSFEGAGVSCLSRAATISVCGDKFLTTLALEAAGVPTPKTVLALSEEAALRAMERLGFPVVLKPVVGSWGRLIARAVDVESAEALLEHKAALTNPLHHVYYVQAYVPKPGFDLRSLVAGDRVVATMSRASEGFRTNARRGARCDRFDTTEEFEEIVLRAAAAVGGGVLGVDALPSDGSFLVHEVNHTPEFRATQGATGVNIAAAILDYAQEVFRR